MAKKQLEVFYALEVAKTQWYHFTVFTIVGMGFFTGAYNLFCISTVTRLIGRLYYFDSTSAKPAPGSLPPNVLAVVNGVALCGTLAGQLFFGWMGDKLGRKKVYGITLLLMATTSIASGLSLGGTAKSVITTLCFFRFWLGFGIGGNYPLSATIMAEYANKRTRGGFIAAVFAMQGFGMLAVGAVAMIVSAGFKKKYSGQSFQIDQESSFHRKADYVWRIILMFGAVPAALTYYLQMKMPETARYTALVERNVKQAAADMSKLLRVDIKEDEILVESQEQPARFGLFSREFARRHGWHLVGTACTWFLLDIAFYSQNLFQKDMFTAAGWLPLATKMNAIEEVYRTARAQSIIALFSTVPGYWFTVAFVDNIGRKTIQLVGFFLMTFFMFVLSIRYNSWRGTECLKGYCGGHPEAFVIFYAFTFFFSNFGPNSTTFIVPAEIFPARFRSTCYGISAAAGKAGAIIGAFGFLYAAQSTDPLKVQKGFHTGIGVKNCLLILGVTNALGSLFTFLIPETIGKTLEELSGENDEEQGDGTASYQIRRGYR